MQHVVPNDSVEAWHTSQTMQARLKNTRTKTHQIVYHWLAITTPFIFYNTHARPHVWCCILDLIAVNEWMILFCVSASRWSLHTKYCYLLAHWARMYCTQMAGSHEMICLSTLSSLSRQPIHSITSPLTFIHINNSVEACMSMSMCSLVCDDPEYWCAIAILLCTFH